MKTFSLSLFFILFSLMLSAQYETDRHSTNFHDAWISCEQSTSPNNKWGERHWIKYEFDAIYVLNKMTLWNYNDRENNGFGVRDVIIDYSIDGETWNEWGLFSFEKAEESSFYMGDEGPDFDGLNAKYLLFTVLSNWGGGTCSGIGEIKIETEGFSPTSTDLITTSIKTDLFPNPATITTSLSLVLNTLDELTFTIVDLTGKRVANWKNIPQTNDHQEIINTRALAPGTYAIYINQNNKVSAEKLVIIE